MGNNVTKETIRKSWTYRSSLFAVLGDVVAIAIFAIALVVMFGCTEGIVKIVVTIVLSAILLFGVVKTIMQLVKTCKLVSSPADYTMYEAKCYCGKLEEEQHSDDENTTVTLKLTVYIQFTDCTGKEQKLSIQIRYGKVPNESKALHTAGVSVGFDEKTSRWFVMENIRELYQ